MSTNSTARTYDVTDTDRSAWVRMGAFEADEFPDGGTGAVTVLELP
jgi:hypothetical protein